MPNINNGLFFNCSACEGVHTFREEAERCMKIHDLERGDEIMMPVDEEGLEIRAHCRVTSAPDENSEGALFVEWVKILVNGEDRTETYRKHLGEERGMPSDKFTDEVVDDIEVLN